MSDSDEMPGLEDDSTVPQQQQQPRPPPPGTSGTGRPTTGKVMNMRPAEDNMMNNSDCSDDDDDNEDEWEEIEETVTVKTLCLFCPSISLSVAACLAHMIDAHGFDFVPFVGQMGLDQVGFIKLVNYTRKNQPTPETLNLLEKNVWDAVEYMKPIIDDDALLMYDMEEVSSRPEEVEETYSVMYKDASTEELRDIINRQREVMQRMLQASQTNNKPTEGWVKTVGDMRPEEDEGYFSSYAHFDIHHEMLSDRVRTESYRVALEDNPELLQNKRVLDLGCGTGILSLFSARAGAMVVAIDMSEVIFQAMDIVKENKMEDRITLLRGRLEDMDFSGQKFDIIVSEWMGYFLLFEGMLDSVIYARDHHLAEAGRLLPDRCTMMLLAADDMESYNKLVGFWDDVYGFKMTCMKREVVKEASTDIINSEKVITSAAQIADFDLMTIEPRDTEFSTGFVLTASHTGQITCLVGYFDTYFQLPCPVSFSTGPHAAPTHWKQTVFYLPHPRPVSAGEDVSGRITVRRKRKEVRSLDVVITLDGNTYRYMVE